MKNIAFGQLLEKLLYLSNQKKSTLAKKLGYDISYISKWINGRNLPTQKSIANICKVTSNFIVESLTPTSKQELKHYFEIEIDIKDDNVLAQYIDRNLKESYMITAQKSSSNIYKSTHSEDNYNSIMHINPRLRKQYLAKDAGLYIGKSSKLDLILSANLYRLNSNDKLAIAEMKETLASIQKDSDVKARVMMGFEGSKKDIVLNTILIIDMITLYPNLDFEIYNCNVDTSAILAVIKDRIFHSAVFTGDGRCLFTNMTKEKNIIDEVYYSLEETLKNQGKLLVEKESPLTILKDKTYIQYIMGQDLRWLIGSINEFFMPSDLFMEVAEAVFGDDQDLLQELSQINSFLQNVTYRSKIDVLIYEAELMKYISTGEINFFNIPVKLTIEQMERHIENIEKIIKDYENINIKVVDGDFVEEFATNLNPSLYLSRSVRLIKTHPTNGINDYAIVKDGEFKKICDELFEELWNNKDYMLVSDKNDILERISKALVYTRIINGRIS